MNVWRVDRDDVGGRENSSNSKRSSSNSQGSGHDKPVWLKRIKYLSHKFQSAKVRVFIYHLQRMEGGDGKASANG